MRNARRMLLGLALAAGARAGDEAKPVRRYQIELLYTVHASVDTDEKLERIRALVLKIYPRAKFDEVSVEDRKNYFGTYRDRLFATVGKAEVLHKGYELVKDQVRREVELRSIYRFLWLQAKDEESLKKTFDQLREKDDPKVPVCGTEPGKTLIVYRDFGGKGLSGAELQEIEDSGVKFGPSFRARVLGVGTNDLPKLGLKADTFGQEGHGRQIFRLVAVTEEGAPEAPPDRK